MQVGTTPISIEGQLLTIFSVIPLYSERRLTASQISLPQLLITTQEIQAYTWQMLETVPVQQMDSVKLIHSLSNQLVEEIEKLIR